MPVHGLRDVFSRAARKAALGIVHHRDHDHRYVVEHRISFECIEHQPAIHLRHHYIERYCDRPELMGEANPFLPAARANDLEPFLAQKAAHQIALRRVIVYYEHGRARIGKNVSASIVSRYDFDDVVRGVGSQLHFRFLHYGGQLDRECAAFSGSAAESHVATHHLAESAGESEPEARAAELAGGRCISLREILEQFHDLVGAETNAGIFDTEDDPFGTVHGLSLGVQRDRALVRELRGVRQEIEESLTNLDLVRMHGAQVRSALDVELVGVLFDHRLNGCGNLVDERLEIEILEEQLHLARFDLGEIQNVVDQGKQVPA